MRAQAHTLESIIASLLLLTSIVFALQMTAVTPLSASTSSQHIENQQQGSAEGVLSQAAANGSLRRAVLYWNSSNNEYHDTSDERYYTSNPPPNAFGELLSEAFGSRGIAYNVRVHWRKPGGADGSQLMVYQGAPSDNAVATSRTIVLSDGAQVLNSTMEADGVVNSSSFYMPDGADRDGSSDSAVYNVVEVEVIVWRI
jgi:hypothetical protein